MRHWVFVVLVAVIAAAVGAGAAFYFAYPNQVQLVGGEARSELLSLNAPPGTLTRLWPVRRPPCGRRLAADSNRSRTVMGLTEART
jgi:hypothetical protein